MGVLRYDAGMGERQAMGYIKSRDGRQMVGASMHVETYAEFLANVALRRQPQAPQVVPPPTLETRPGVVRTSLREEAQPRKIESSPKIESLPMSETPTRSRVSRKGKNTWRDHLAQTAYVLSCIHLTRTEGFTANEITDMGFVLFPKSRLFRRPDNENLPCRKQVTARLSGHLDGWLAQVLVRGGLRDNYQCFRLTDAGYEYGRACAVSVPTTEQLVAMWDAAEQRLSLGPSPFHHS